MELEDFDKMNDEMRAKIKADERLVKVRHEMEASDEKTSLYYRLLPEMIQAEARLNFLRQAG